MTGNYQLPDTGAPKNAQKRQRCSEEIARRYRCKEGDPRRVQNAIPEAAAGGRQVAVRAVVEHLFGVRSEGAPAALGCEPYLRHALGRWLLGTCRTPESWSAYAMRMWRWVGDSDRRSLSAQTDASPAAVGDWLYALENRGLSARTVVSHREALRSWFRWLFDRDLVHRSPVTRDHVRAFRVDHGSIEKGDGLRQALTKAEAMDVARWMLTEASPEAGLAVALQMIAGLRSGEVVALRKRHVTERGGVVTLAVPGKGNRLRQVTLEEIVVRALHRYEDERRRQGVRGHLLVAPGGGAYTTRHVRRWAKQAAAVVGRADLISSHDLRKTAATLLIEAGARLDQVQVHLGHTSSETTRRCYVVRDRGMPVTTGIHFITNN